MTYCVRVITRLCFFFVFSLFFLCFQMHCASIYSSFLLFLSCVDLELWYFSLQSQLWQPFVNQISNLGIYHFWNCSHLALHLPPCIDFPLLNNVLIHTEENFYDTELEEENRKKYTRDFCAELASHLIHEKSLPKECRKFNDVVTNLRRRDSDTSHPTQWMS